RPGLPRAALLRPHGRGVAGGVRRPARGGVLRGHRAAPRADGPGCLPPRPAGPPRRRGRLPGDLPGARPEGGGGPAGCGRELALRGRLPDRPERPPGRRPPPGQGETGGPHAPPDDRAGRGLGGVATTTRRRVGPPARQVPLRLRAVRPGGVDPSDAAWHLGVPEGTVSGRLTTARRMLAARLTRRGLTLSVGALVAALSQGAAAAAVP